MEVVGQQESPDKMESTTAEYTVVDEMDGQIDDIDHNITDEERKLLEETEGDTGVENGETEQETDVETADEQGNPEVTLALSLQEKGYKYKSEYVRDAVRNRRMKTFAMYPINMQDLASSSVKMCLEKCCDFNWNVSDITRTDSNALEGILDIQFSTMEDAEEAEQLLPGVKEGLKLHRLTGGSDKTLDEAQQSHRFDEIGSKLLDNYKEKERPAKRMLVITNLPESVTERKLLEIFPTGFVGIALKDSKERLGHAIVEFDTREEMLAELEHRNGVEVGGVSLKLVDMMMTGVEQLEKRTVFTKAKELADVRVELARSWHIHYSHERKNFIKRIYGLETQLKLDESLKGQTDSETSIWRVEVKRRLEKKQEDMPEDRTARLMMSVEDLCKEYEKHASMEPSTIRSSSYRGSGGGGGGGGAMRGSRSSWNRDNDFDDFRSGYSRHSSRGGYRDEGFRRRAPYSRDFRDRGPSREGGVSGLKSELGSLIQGSLSEQNQAQALDLLAGLTEILGSKGGQKQGQQSVSQMQHNYSPSSSASSYMRSDSDTSIQQRDIYGSYSTRMESPRGSRGRGGGGGGGAGRGRGSRRSEYRVIVAGLPQTGSWQDLKDHMRTCGDVCYSEVNKDGTGVVEYTRFDDMKIAIRKLDDSKFQSHQGEASYIRVREDFHGGGSSGASRW